MSTGDKAIGFKLIVREKDRGWTKLAKRVINGVMDYAASVNESDSSARFKTISIGEWAERDGFPGFYIIFPQYNAQVQEQYHRREQTFQFRCTITCKGKDYKDSLQQLLELFGDFQFACETDKVMRTIPADPIAETYHIEPMGLVLGTGTGEGARSFEYVYGQTLVVVRALLDARK